MQRLLAKLIQFAPAFQKFAAEFVAKKGIV